jgi:hypothetical protein
VRSRMQQPERLMLRVLVTSEKIRPLEENPQILSRTERGERRSRRSERSGWPGPGVGTEASGCLGF